MIGNESFSRKHRFSLFDKIRKEQNKRNIESLLKEVHFGLFLNKIGTKIKYDPVMGEKLTPDFSFNKFGQEIIVEVARVKPVKQDMDIDDAEDQAISTFQLVNPGKRFMTKPQSIIWKP